MTPAAILVMNLFVVNFGMCGCRDDGEVGVTVVGFDTVDVVDMIAGFDRPAHFVCGGSTMCESPARPGVELAIAIERAEVCHRAPP